MTLDEAIKHAEEVAEENEKFCYKKGGKGDYFNEDTDWNNAKCAEEHRQLAEWLKDYKRLLEPKTGHWKYYQNEKGNWINECSVCGLDAGVGYQYPYCPNCGIRMNEPQESEGQMEEYIKLVVKIDEDTYKNIIKNGFIYDEDNEIVTHAIKSGAPLPKGHGRLIDADMFEKRLMNAMLYYLGEKADDFDLRYAAGLKSAAERLVDVPTIIEADKESEG